MQETSATSMVLHVLVQGFAPITAKINVLKLPKGLLPGHNLHSSGVLTDEITAV